MSKLTNPFSNPGHERRYSLFVSRQVEQRWSYTVYATSKEEAEKKFHNGEWSRETKGDSCGDDGDPQVVSIAEVE